MFFCKSYQKFLKGDMLMNQKESKRPAQLLGERLRMSNSNLEVMEAMAQLRRKKTEERLADEMETAASKTLYYF